MEEHTLKGEYISILKDGRLSYGGSQRWSDSPVLRGYGCGVIAALDLLLYLARHPNRSVSAQELYEAVWQQPMGDDPHAVRMTISRLKQKLGGEDARVTVNSYRSSGYRLEEQ